MISACTNFKSSLDAPDFFRLSKSITAVLPNTSSKPNFFKQLVNITYCFLRKVVEFNFLIQK